MKPDNKAGGPWLYALGLVPVIWFALLIAPAISGGTFGDRQRPACGNEQSIQNRVV